MRARYSRMSHMYPGTSSRRMRGVHAGMTPAEKQEVDRPRDSRCPPGADVRGGHGVSFSYPSGSLRLEARAAFGAELDVALRARKVSAEFVGRVLGVEGVHGAGLAQGQLAPLPETAQRLAALLKWPGAYPLAVAARTATCLSCGSSFVDRSNAPGRFCGPQCRKVRLKSRNRALSGAAGRAPRAGGSRPHGGHARLLQER